MDQEHRIETTALAPGLYLVATPIGNLEDITLRALRVLRSVDKIACEDTRHTRKLLNHFGISTPTVSYHMHNEAARTEEMIALLREGARIAVVSDAGTPGIADPGGVVVATALAAGIAVHPVPGPNAAVAAFSASGLSGSTEQGPGFLFVGFLPSKRGQRKTALEKLNKETKDAGRILIAYEAPHRIIETLEDLAAVFTSGLQVVLARELTKIHEEFLRGTVEEIQRQLAARDSIRGEMVLLFRPGSALCQTAQSDGIAEQVREMMEQHGMDEKEALKRVARARGIGKSEAYRELQRARVR